MRGFSPNENSLPLRSSETTGPTVSTTGGRYFTNATYQVPGSVNIFEKPVYTRPYAAYPAASSHVTTQRGQTAEAVVTSVPLTMASHRDELVWSNPSANCMSIARDHNVAPPAVTSKKEFLEGNPSSDAGQQQTLNSDIANNNSHSNSLPRDRRSWSVQSENPPLLQQRDARRASLASDRLGPCRPTSLTDFKRLLIQTRSQTNPAGERKSASELLKIHKATLPPPSTTVTSVSNTPASSGSVKRGMAIKFNSGIEPIQEEGESQQNSPAKPSLV